MKLPSRHLLIAVIILGILGAVFSWATRPKPIAVVLKTIDRGRVEATLANTRAGEVTACQRTKLSTILGGRIDVLAVKEGDHVKKGQLLMKLWNEDQRAQQTLAETQLDLARKQVAESCAVADNASREAERTTKLFRQGFVSVSKDDAARADAVAKRAACASAKANVSQAGARVAAARVETGRTVLYAPFAGVVAKIVGEVGEYSTPSPPGVPTPPAIDLIDPTCLYVSAPMDEVDAPKIRVGQPARITIDAFGKRQFVARVRRVAPYVTAIEKQARTVDVEVDFAKPEEIRNLLVGYSANVEIVLEVHDNVLRVPTAALLEGGKVLVYRADDGVLEERKVTTGIANWEYTEILDGLKAGERVAVSLEKEGVKAGARVTPTGDKS